MATTIITGRDLTLTIDGKAYNDAASSVTMQLTNEQSEYDVLSGTTYKTLKTTGTLSVEMFQDWGVVNSLCEAMFAKAQDAPDTGLAFTFVANTGATFTGDILPNFPAAGGAAPGELTASVEFKIVNGAVDLA